MKTGAERMYSNLSEKHGYSWEQAPAVPSCAETAPCSDVVVIGGGFAGLAAAARAAENGLKVTVLEAADAAEVTADDLIGAVNTRCMEKAGIHIAKAKFVRDWESFCDGRAYEELLWQFANRSGEAADWLIGLLGEDGEAVLIETGYRGTDVAACGGDHLLRSKPESGLPAFGGALLIALLKREIERCGGQIIYRQRAAAVQQKECGCVSGVIAQDENGVCTLYPASKAVVLAAGDILGNEEWMEAFCGAGLRQNAGAVGGKGEAHTLAYRAGASFEYPQWAMDVRNTAYTPFSLPFLSVNRLGRRFMNEDTWDQAKAVRCAMQPGGDFAWTVFDADWKAELEKQLDLCGLAMTLPGAVTKADALAALSDALAAALQDGNAVQADTLEELAAKMDVPADQLETAVKKYNTDAAAGTDSAFGKQSGLMSAIAQPPYFAAKWGPELKAVCGGIRVDKSMRVLRADGTPIPGLYANGSCTAGLFELYLPPLLAGAVNGAALTGACVLAEELNQEG